MQNNKYQVTYKYNFAMYSPSDHAWEAIDKAASYKGFATTFERDEEGVMRFYVSSNPMGNNPYKPTAREASVQGSSLIDDDLAKEDLALKIIASQTPLHSCYGGIRVQVLSFEDGVLHSIDEESVHDILMYRRYLFYCDKKKELDQFIMRNLIGYGIPFNPENPKDSIHSNLNSSS